MKGSKPGQRRWGGEWRGGGPLGHPPSPSLSLLAPSSDTVVAVKTLSTDIERRNRAERQREERGAVKGKRANRQRAQVTQLPIEPGLSMSSTVRELKRAMETKAREHTQASPSLQKHLQTPSLPSTLSPLHHSRCDPKASAKSRPSHLSVSSLSTGPPLSALERGRVQSHTDLPS